jgi:hypothetical protein
MTGLNAEAAGLDTERRGGAAQFGGDAARLVSDHPEQRVPNHVPNSAILARFKRI